MHPNGFNEMHETFLLHKTNNVSYITKLVQVSWYLAKPYDNLIYPSEVKMWYSVHNAIANHLIDAVVFHSWPLPNPGC